MGNQMNEESIKNELCARFDFLAETTVIQRPRRIFCELANDNFSPVFDFCVNNLGFSILAAITGNDMVDRFMVIYHMSRDSSIFLNLKVTLPRDNPEIGSITATFPCAELYERELVDLLGIRVNGLPEGRRYPLSDDWPTDQHPLRKDWNRPGTEPKAE